MNRWGVSAWDNQAAANWFVTINESEDPVAGVLETLHLDVVEYREEVRAAAAMVVVMIEADRWPADRVEASLELSISRLQEIRDKNLLDDDPELRDAIGHEIGVLRARLLRAPSRGSAGKESGARLGACPRTGE